MSALHTGPYLMNDIFHLFYTVCTLNTELLDTTGTLRRCQAAFPDLLTRPLQCVEEHGDRHL